MSHFPPSRLDPGALRRDSPKMYPCRTAGCKNLRGTAKLVCMTCWWRIPQPLRVEVGESWREYVRRPTPAARDRYIDAKTRALAEAAQKVGT